MVSVTAGTFCRPKSLPMPPVEPPMPPGFTTVDAESDLGRNRKARRSPHEAFRKEKVEQVTGFRKYASANVRLPMCSSLSIEVVAALTSTHTPTMACGLNVALRGRTFQSKCCAIALGRP